MNNTKVSVVILNWLRPENIHKKILPSLAQCPIVGEVIISHGRSDTYFDWQCSNLSIHHRKDFILNQEYGLSLRFVCASQATFSTIVFIDDDLVPHPATLINMFRLYQKNAPCLVGRFGRFPTNPIGYSSLPISDKFTEAPLLLTSLLFAPKSLCFDFFQATTPIKEFVKLESRPLWNGEDLTLSLMSVSRYGKWGIVAGNPKHFPVHKLRTKRDKEVAISSQSCHVPYRSKLLRQLITVLRIHPSLLYNKKTLIKPKLK